MTKETWVSAIAGAVMAGLTAAVGLAGKAAVWVVVATGIIAFCGTLVAGLRIPRSGDIARIRASERPAPVKPRIPPPPRE